MASTSAFCATTGRIVLRVIVVPLGGGGEQQVATLLADTTAPPRIEWSRDGRKLYASERMAAHRCKQRIGGDRPPIGFEAYSDCSPRPLPTEGVPGDDEATPGLRMANPSRSGDVSMPAPETMYVARLGASASADHPRSQRHRRPWRGPSRWPEPLIISSRRSSSLQLDAVAFPPRRWRTGLPDGCLLWPPCSRRSARAMAPSRTPRGMLDSNIWRDRSDRQVARHRGSSPAICWTPHPSIRPDGGRIALRSNRTGNDEIWITNSDGKSPDQVTNSERPGDRQRALVAGRPVSMVFDSRPNGNSDILLIPAAGGRVAAADPGAFRPRGAAEGFSQDGKYVYFSSFDRTQGRGRCWRQSLDGGAAQQITRRNRGFASQESPDRRWIYYSKPDTDGLFPGTAGHGGGGDVCAPLASRGVLGRMGAHAGEKILYFCATGGRAERRLYRVEDAGSVQRQNVGRHERRSFLRFDGMGWGAGGFRPMSITRWWPLLEREGSGEIHIQNEQ